MVNKVFNALRKHRLKSAKQLETKSTPLLLAIEFNEQPRLDLLLNQSQKSRPRALLKRELGEALLLAIALKNQLIVNTLLAFCFHNNLLEEVLKHQNTDGLYALSCAACRNDQSIISTILLWINHHCEEKKTAPLLINQRDTHGKTALIWAIQNKAWESTVLLLTCIKKLRLNITFTDTKGYSALTYATEHSNYLLIESIIEVLRKYHTPQQLVTLLTQRCIQGETVLEKAFKNNDELICFLFISEGHRMEISFMDLVPDLWMAIHIAIYCYRKNPFFYHLLLKEEFLSYVSTHVGTLILKATQQDNDLIVDWLLQYTHPHDLEVVLNQLLPPPHRIKLQTLLEKHKKVFDFEKTTLAKDSIDVSFVQHDQASRRLDFPFFKPESLLPLEGTIEDTYSFMT